MLYSPSYFIYQTLKPLNQAIEKLSPYYFAKFNVLLNIINFKFINQNWKNKTHGLQLIGNRRLVLKL